MERKRNGRWTRFFGVVLTVALAVVLAAPSGGAVSAIELPDAGIGADAVAEAGADAGTGAGVEDGGARGEVTAEAEALFAGARASGVKAFEQLGPPPVDAEITSLPYTDTKTMDANTHRVKFSLLDEVVEYRGFVYKLSLTKGVTYSISMIYNPADSFYCINLFLDDKSDVDILMPMTDGVFTAEYSGTYYMLVTDLGLTNGGSYTLRFEEAACITGKVTNSRGKALKDVNVLYYSAKASRDPGNYVGEALTDSRGRYSIGVLPGSYKVLFFTEGSYYRPPKYKAEYAGNKRTIRAARIINVKAGQTRSGVNAKLAAYRAPKADRKVASLPFSVSSSVGAGSQEVQLLDDVPCRAKVYSVRLYKGRSYEFALQGKKGSISPSLWVVDSKGYIAGGSMAQDDDRKMAMAPLTISVTGDYRLIVSDSQRAPSFKFSLRVSEAYNPGSITGRFTNRAGHPLYGMVALVYKKNGKRWASYMSDEVEIDGSYQVTGLKAGTYKVKFSDSDILPDYRTVRYYKKGRLSGVRSRAKGTAVKVGAGRTIRNIDVRY